MAHPACTASVGTSCVLPWNCRFSSAEGGVTPGPLRGSGATFYYKRCEDIPRLAWRGRWLGPAALEVAGQVLLTCFSTEARQELKDLSELVLRLDSLWPIFRTLCE